MQQKSIISKTPNPILIYMKNTNNYHPDRAFLCNSSSFLLHKKGCALPSPDNIYMCQIAWKDTA